MGTVLLVCSIVVFKIPIVNKLQVVASIFKSDEDFMKALEDPLYTHINEALYRKNQQNKVFEEKELDYQIDQTGMHHFQEKQQQNLSEELPENSIEVQQENSMEDQKGHGICDADEPAKTANETIAFGEIEEEESKEGRHDEEEDQDRDDIVELSIAEKSDFKSQRISVISPEVEKALQTLDEVINMMRKCRFNTEVKAASYLSDEKPPDTEKDTEKNLSTLGDSNVRPKVERLASSSKKETMERAAEEPPRTSSNHSSR